MSTERAAAVKQYVDNMKMIENKTKEMKMMAEEIATTATKITNVSFDDAISDNEKAEK